MTLGINRRLLSPDIGVQRDNGKEDLAINLWLSRMRRPVGIQNLTFPVGPREHHRPKGQATGWWATWRQPRSEVQIALAIEVQAPGAKASGML